MALSNMRYPITQRKAENAGITWVTGSDRIIWGLAWELPLFMEGTFCQYTEICRNIWKTAETPEKIRKMSPLSREDEMAEFMFLGLRMTRGISESEFERQFGSEIDAYLWVCSGKYKSMDCFWKKTRIFRRGNSCKQFRYGRFFAVNALTTNVPVLY